MNLGLKTSMWVLSALIATYLRLWSRVWLMGLFAAFWLTFSPRHVIRAVARRRGHAT